MKWRTKVIAALLALAIVMAAALFIRPANKARAKAETTRHALVEQGFKLEFKDFQRTNSDQVRSNLMILIEAGYACSQLYDQGSPKLMEPVGSNAALVVWNQAKLDASLTDDLWPELRTKLEERRAILDEACAVVLAGPIRFDLGVLWT